MKHKMSIRVGDLVAGFYDGKHYLGIISKLNHRYQPMESAYHSVLWISGHWAGQEVTHYVDADIESLRRQFLNWQLKEYKC